MAMAGGRDDGAPMMEMNMTPLIDVLLVLLIVFIMSIPIATHAIAIDLPTPSPVRDDGRPEAGRRDALALIEAADAALEITEEQRRRAAAELERAARERAELGDVAEVESRIAGLQRELPEVIELPPSAPPSAAIRLQRAGLRVTVDAPA